jgi:3-dehydroquinate synthase
MVLAARLSRRLGLIAQQDVARIVSLLCRANLPVEAPEVGVERYLELMSHDKKVESGLLRFVLLRRLGDAYVTSEVPAAAVEEVLARRAANA